MKPCNKHVFLSDSRSVGGEGDAMGANAICRVSTEKRSLEDTQVLTGAKNRENKLYHVRWRLRVLANMSFFFLKI